MPAPTETRLLESSEAEAAVFDSAQDSPPSRRRGRPLLMSREAVLERIRALAGRPEGLFRMHRAHPGLYARARRLFGSWSSAVSAAGLDYAAAVGLARERSLRMRRNRRRGVRRPR